MMHKAFESRLSGTYCAFRNGIEVPEEYRENLEKISDNGDFTIYRFRVTD